MRKSNIKQLLRQSAGATNLDESADNDQLFQRYEKNLYKTHSVPKIRIHQAKYW